MDVLKKPERTNFSNNSISSLGSDSGDIEDSDVGTETSASIIQDEQSENDSTISILPPDLLSKILNYSPMIQWADLEKVNRSFRDATWMLWKVTQEVHLDKLLNRCGIFSDEEKNTTQLNSLLEKLLRRAPKITQLTSFPSSYSLSVSSVRSLARFSHLTIIDFQKIKMQAGDLAEFLESTLSRRSLRSLHLSDNGMDEYDNQVKLMLHLAFGQQYGSETLKLENFSFPKTFTPELSFFEVMDVSRLISLDLANIIIRERYLISLIERCTRLERLGFNLNEVSEQYVELIFRVVIGSTSQTLLSLKFNCVGYGGDWHSMATFNKFIRQFSISGKLKELILEGNKSWNYTDIYGRLGNVVVSELHFLISLDLYRLLVNDDDILTRLANMKQLETLRIRSAELKWRSLFLSLISILGTELPNLKWLHLGVPERDKCILNDITCLCHLKGLHLDGFELPRPNISMLGTNGLVPEFESFALSRCKNVTDENLMSLIKDMTYLRKLDLSRTEISNCILLEIGKSCPLISELDISYCNSITIGGIQEFIDECTNLEKLVAQGFNLRRNMLKVSKYRNICIIA